MISFEIPKEPILRGYLFSFINSLDPSPIRVRSEGDFVIIEHIKKRKVTGLIAKVYEKASSKIEGGNFKVALSNNDKAIIIRARTKDKPTIFSALGLTPEQSMEDVFKKTASIVKQMTNEEFQREYYTSRLRFAPPSLLRIEHYQAGRAPFFISKKLDRTKPEYLTLLQIVTFLAGYVISHSGYVLADGGQRRAMLILPQVIGKTKKSFYDLILDYYKNYSSHENQKKLFLRCLEIASHLDLPVILHNRQAEGDMLDMLKRFPYLRGVIHCFSGGFKEAEFYINLGFKLGFNGIITFTNDYNEIIKSINLGYILLETDCPYLTPPPFRGKRNEPLYVKYVAEKIAAVKDISFEEVEKITDKNANELFRI